MLSRQALLAATCALPVTSRVAAAADASAIAIIDTPHDTRRWLKALRDKDVEIVGRYYSRAFQSLLPQKRLIYNGDEAQRLLDAGFAILSEYQYASSSPMKFLCGVGGRTGPRGMDHKAVAVR